MIDCTALYNAIRKKDLKQVQSILNYEETCHERSRKNLERSFYYKSNSGETLLHLAVKREFEDLVNWLVKDLNFDINSTDDDGKTALHLAALSENESMVAYLLERNASTTVKDHRGNSPFHNAVTSNNMNLVNLFLKYGADVLDRTENTHETSFHLALNNHLGSGEVFQHLLENHRGDFDFIDDDIQTLLHALAPRKGYIHFARFILARGANPNHQSKGNGFTPLHVAIHRSNYEMCKLLLEHDADLLLEDNNNQFTPLESAISYQDTRIVKLLLEHNNNVFCYLRKIKSLLHVAVYNYKEETLRLLLKHGADITQRAKTCDGRMTPFQYAVYNGHFEAAKILLAAGSDINSKVGRRMVRDLTYLKYRLTGCTVLHWALSKGREIAVRFLLQNGAKLIFSEKADVDVFIAVRSGSTQYLEALVEHGAKVNITIKDEPLIDDALMDSNKMNETSLLPIRDALMAFDKKMVETLILFGADRKELNATNRRGQTALHLAVIKNRDSFVEYLLEMGADVNQVDDSMFTAFDYAEFPRYYRGAEIILAHIAILKYKNEFVSEQLENRIQNRNLCHNYYLNCLKELELLSNLTSQQFSIVQLLTRDSRTWTKMITVTKIVNEFEKLNETEYPKYYNKLKLRWDKAFHRRKMMGRAIEASENIAALRKLHDAMEYVFENFTDSELLYFVRKFETENPTLKDTKTNCTDITVTSKEQTITHSDSVE